MLCAPGLTLAPNRTAEGNGNGGGGGAALVLWRADGSEASRLALPPAPAALGLTWGRPRCCHAGAGSDSNGGEGEEEGDGDESGAVEGLEAAPTYLATASPGKRNAVALAAGEGAPAIGPAALIASPVPAGEDGPAPPPFHVK